MKSVQRTQTYLDDLNAIEALESLDALIRPMLDQRHWAGVHAHGAGCHSACNHQPDPMLR